MVSDTGTIGMGVICTRVTIVWHVKDVERKKLLTKGEATFFSSRSQIVFMEHFNVE